MTKESVRSTYKIYVGNLAPQTSNNDLVRVFSQYGTVVEAVALANKGFGFVHMTNEDDGVRAMKSLYKYLLNGKEMVVQPAINPKKASVNQYNSSKRATIGGRGVSNLDDFDDYMELQYLEQEMTNCIESSDISQDCNSSSPSYNAYSSSSSATALSGIQNSRTSNDSPSCSSIVTASSQASRNKPDTDTSLSSLANGIATPFNNTNGLNVAHGTLPGLLLPQSTCNNNSVDTTLTIRNTLSSNLSNTWGLDSGVAQPVSSVSNSQFSSLAQGNLSQSNNTLLNLNHPSVNPGLAEHLNNKLKGSHANQVTNSSIGLDPNLTLNKINPLVNQLHQLRAALQQNPNSTQLLTAIARLQQDLAVTQTLTHNELLNPKLTKDDQVLEDSIQKLKQQQLQEQELQRILMQQRQVVNNNSGSLNGQFLNTNLLPVSLVSATNNNSGLDNGSIFSNLSNGLLSSNMSKLNNGGHPFNHGSQNMSSNNLPTSTNTTSVSFPPRCGLCAEPYNSSNRIPKILGCTHTFCLSCLHIVALAAGHGGITELRCPGRCGVTTHLSEAGVEGLTSNQAVLTAVMQFNASSNDSPDSPLVTPLSMNIEVCASCTGTRLEQHINACRAEGHLLVPSREAVQLIMTQLRPLVQTTLGTLKEAMRLRSGIKERIEGTLEALAKFMEELKRKLLSDSQEEDYLRSTVNDLNNVLQQLERQSYSDLVKTYHMVDKCSKDIGLQYSQCVKATCTNDCVQAVILQIRPNSLSDTSKLGVGQHEVFPIEQSLLEHARLGNYANVLLQYMVGDLLSSRISHNAILSGGKDVGGDRGFAVNTIAINSADSLDNLSSLQESHSVSSVSPVVCVSDNMQTSDANMALTNDGGVAFRSLTASSSATPDMAAMNGHHQYDQLGNSMDNLDINCLIKTTEAIEAEARSHSEPVQFSESSTSLGLSNIVLAVNNEATIESVDMQKSLLESSACIEPELSSKIQSSAPSPSSSNAGSPIVSSNTRAIHSSAASSDSGISSCKPFSYLDAAKKPAKPQPEPPVKTEVVKITPQIKQIKTPHCWMKVTVDGNPIGRIVFQLRPDKAPKMCENFLGLCTGKPGYGYQGTHFFKNGDGFLAGGDVEYDDGTGGYSIFGKKKFEADLCPLKDEVGMIRFKGNGTSENGRGMVGSQFMVWYAEREFKKFSYSLVFGRVVDGLDIVKKAANVNLTKHDVMIEECGGIM